MTVEENKAIVARFINLFSASQVDEAFALLADDFIWQTYGDLPFSGRHGKATVRGFADGLRDGFTVKPAWLIDRIIGEGDTVAVEARTIGDTTSGFAYRNHYHLAVELRDGLISEIREYMDTGHCWALVRALQPVVA